jgi:hypothetical protein
MDFNSIAALLEKIEKSYKPKKKGSLKIIVQDWWLHVLRKYPAAINSIFHIFQCLSPELDKRRKFAMLEKKLGNYILQIFDLKKTLKGSVIENWKGEPNVPSHNQGDLASRIEHIMTLNDIPNINSLPLLELHNLLDELALLCKWSTIKRDDLNTTRSATSILSDLYIGQSPVNMKWLTRIILKDMGPKLPTDSFSLMYAFHPCMVPLYHIRSCLQETCDTVGDIILEDISYAKFFGSNDEFNIKLYISTLRKFAVPKLHTFITTCESNQAKSTADIYLAFSKINEKAFYAEKKYDG